MGIKTLKRILLFFLKGVGLSFDIFDIGIIIESPYLLKGVIRSWCFSLINIEIFLRKEGEFFRFFSLNVGWQQKRGVVWKKGWHYWLYIFDKKIFDVQ